MWSMALMVVIIGLSSCAAGLVGGMVGGWAAYNKNKLAASQSQEKVVPKLSPEDQRLYDHYFLDAMVEDYAHQTRRIIPCIMEKMLTIVMELLRSWGRLWLIIWRRVSMSLV